MSHTVVPIKLILHKRHSEEHHRLCGSFHWDELHSFIAFVMNWPHVIVEYQDTDGDTVEVSCHAEWEECLRLHRLPSTAAAAPGPLRLHVRRSQYVKPSCVPRLNMAARPTPSSGDVQQQEETASYVRFSSQHDEDLMDLLSILFVCDAPSVMFNTPLTEPLPWPVTAERTIVGERDVSLSIDMTELRSAVVQHTAADTQPDTTTTLAPEDRWREMEKVLAIALRLFPGDPELEFRTAAVKDRLGKREEAAELLNRAKSLSLNAAQLKVFQNSSAMKSLLANADSASPAMNTEAVARMHQVRQLLKLFPQADPEVIEDLLQRLHGDVTAVAQML